MTASDHIVEENVFVKKSKPLVLVMEILVEKLSH